MGECGFAPEIPSTIRGKRTEGVPGGGGLLCGHERQYTFRGQHFPGRHPGIGDNVQCEGVRRGDSDAGYVGGGKGTCRTGGKGNRAGTGRTRDSDGKRGNGEAGGRCGGVRGLAHGCLCVPETGVREHHA